MSTALTRADGQTVSETILVGLRSQFILAICSMSVFVCVCGGVCVCIVNARLVFSVHLSCQLCF